MTVNILWAPKKKKRKKSYVANTTKNAMLKMANEIKRNEQHP